MRGSQPQAVALSLPLALAGDNKGTSLSHVLCETPSREAHTLAIAPPVPREPHHYHLVREDKVCGKELPTLHSGRGPGELPPPPGVAGQGHQILGDICYRTRTEALSFQLPLCTSVGPATAPLSRDWALQFEHHLGTESIRCPHKLWAPHLREPDRPS